MRKAIISRYGAIGDQIFLSTIWKYLKRDGYYIVFDTNKKGIIVNENNPYIDEYIEYDDQVRPWEWLKERWDRLKADCDRYINFTQSIEVRLVPGNGDELFWESKEERHRQCNINYYDYTLTWAGYPEIRGERPKMWVSEGEDKIFKKFMRRYDADNFVILIALSGSAPHKVYPWTEFVIEEIRKRIPKARFITVGDGLSEIIEWEGKDTFQASGKWSLRKSIIAPKYVDLVIGPDTGIMQAAGCFNTPKILLLSCTTEENISKYFKNCIALHAPEEVKCYPCHRLVKRYDDCPLSSIAQAPSCIANIHPAKLIQAIEYFYEVKHGTANRSHSRPYNNRSPEAQAERGNALRC